MYKGVPPVRGAMLLNNPAAESSSGLAHSAELFFNARRRGDETNFSLSERAATFSDADDVLRARSRDSIAAAKVDAPVMRALGNE